MSIDDDEPDADQDGPPRRGSWAMAAAFLLFVWFAVDVVSIRTLGTSGQPVFKQAGPASTAKSSDVVK
jgi:hypothetical protein